MARFVSFGKKYLHGVRPEITEPTATGVRVMQRPLFAAFSEDGRSSYDLDFGEKHLPRHGLPEDSIDGGEVSPRFNMGIFDTEAAQRLNQWTDDEREIVEKALRNSPFIGIEFVEVLHEEPFAGYDGMSEDNILQALDAGIKVDLALTIAYEQENQNREYLIEQLRERAASSDELVETAVTIDAS